MYKHLIPIEGEKYSELDFIRRINEGYTSQQPQGNTRGRKRFSRYIVRNTCPRFLKVYLNLFYDAASPLLFNGIRHWNSEFEKTFTTLRQRKMYSEYFDKSHYSWDAYLQEVLVANLEKFLVERKIKSQERCGSYRDYILHCIKYNYSPNLEIRWHKKKGWGVYAQEDIYPFTYIGLYTGNIALSLPLKINESKRRFKNNYKWALSFNEHIVINGETAGNYTRFINHDIEQSQRLRAFSIDIASSEKSVLPHRGFLSHFNEQGSFISFRAGEEIVWDYGPRFKL